MRPARVIGLSIPKAGTHLLAAIFKTMGYRAVAHAKAPGRQILDGIDLQSDGDLYVYGRWRAQAEAAKRLADCGFRTIVLIRDGWKKWQEHDALVLRYEDIGRSVRSGILMQELRAIGLDPRTFLAAAEKRLKLRGKPPGECRWQREFDDELQEVWAIHAQGVAASLGYQDI
jgi:hypothetical protein